MDIIPMQPQFPTHLVPVPHFHFSGQGRPVIIFLSTACYLCPCHSRNGFKFGDNAENIQIEEGQPI